MKKTIILSIMALVFALSSVVKAEMTISGYTEFLAGSADQSKYQGVDNQSGIDRAGLDNGFFSRVTANYGTTLDNGIDVSGTMNLTTRDCQGDKAGNCNVVNFNFVNFSGNFGVVSVGERFAAAQYVLSRMTAEVPTGEPDGGLTGYFHASTGTAAGAANEQNYASNSMKVLYATNVYNGFQAAISYDPNTGNSGGGSAADLDGQGTTSNVSGGKWANFNDLLSIGVKYSMEMDGIGLDIAYVNQTGNAGQDGGNNYNDLDETAYSARISYGNFVADYRKNEADNSGYIKNGTAGNDEGTSVCGMYSMGNIRAAACDISTSFTDANNLSNSSSTRTYNADYNLGGGVTIGAVYFTKEVVANSATQDDVEGIMTKLSVGF
tara:strand:- start:1616 stop:2752 length:1137 start_codon:yes stop_codon:yes gene_type:complete